MSANDNNPSGINRRQFLKGAATGAALGAVVVGGGSAVAWPKANVRPSGFPAKWDKEADVVVLGTGTVSIGAITAHEAGAKVLMLEKGAYFGGHTSVSGGKLWIPNNFIMKQAGIADTKEEALTYLKKVAAGQTNDDLLNAFLDNGPQMLEFLRDKAGFKWQPEGWSLTDENMSVFEDYYAEFPGGKKRGRGVAIAREPNQGGGKVLMETAQKEIDRRGIEVMLETQGKRLVTNANGEVVGVIALSKGKEIAVKARRAVLIGTGGFERNKELTMNFLRAPIYFSCGALTNEGDGLLMGMALGASLRNMNEVWGFVGYNVDPNTMSGEPDWSTWRGKPGAIVVNKFGQRIGNESGPYDTFHRAFHSYDTGSFDWRNIPSFTIVDSGYAKNYPMPGSYVAGEVPAWMKKADTLADLANAFGIDAVTLQATVDRFNLNARQGKDPDWHRGEYNFDQRTAGDLSRKDLKNPCLAPLETPPFYGTAVYPGALATNGGLQTNGNAQVLDVTGQVIPRLYCSGNTMASVMGAGYAGGGATIGPGTTFAYIAAKHAAALKPWE